MYKNLEDLPATFGVNELMKVLCLSRNKIYELVKTEGFPKLIIGKKIIISKKHFILWMEKNFKVTE